MTRKIIATILISLLNGFICFIVAQDLMWIQSDSADYQDVHVAFRGAISIESEIEIEFRLSGASWYRVWVDGIVLTEGPDRYAPDFPVYQVRKLLLPAGKHLIAVQVHSEGVDTRMLKGIDPYLYCHVFKKEAEIPVSWKALELNGYARQLRRVSAQFGWLEWSDTSQQPDGWMNMVFDDDVWIHPVKVSRELGDFKPSLISEVHNLEIQFDMTGSGPLANYYGYETDNPSARFFLRDMECTSVPPQGIWKRYDLGKVRLISPRFTMDLPAGAVVEFAFSESLQHGRVMPWINLSVSDSYNMVHFAARGGEQKFHPLTPKAGRYVEMHIIAPPDQIMVLEEKFLERAYHEQADGAFQCEDTLLNRIWQLGAETYMSCAEDALVDNPTRERGLKHFAQSAREDGMVAGLAPGTLGYLSTFAALWTNANLHYWEATGDRSLIEQLYPCAEKNIAAFEQYKTPGGISQDAGWAFVDWGYVPNEGETDMGLNLIYYDALNAMVEWSSELDLGSRTAYYRGLADEMKQIIADWYEPFFAENDVQWAELGEASGKVPLPDGKSIQVRWKKSGGQIEYNIDTPVKIEIYMEDPGKAGKINKMVVRKQKTITLSNND